MEICQNLDLSDIESPHSLRIITEYSEVFGYDADLFTLAAISIGCWWIKNPTQFLKRIGAERTAQWIQDCGLVQFVGEKLIAHVPDELVAPPTCPHIDADVLRIHKIIDENFASIQGLKWKWAIGSILEFLNQSQAAVKVMKKRGISLQALECAINTHPRLRVTPNPEYTFETTVISELKRLHKGRLAWLWVETGENGLAYLRDQSRQTQSFSKPIRPEAQYAPGEIVWVAMEETKHGKRSRKCHPALLLSLTGKRNDKWLVINLTSNVEEKAEIRKVPNPDALGLPHGGYVWHEAQKVYHTQIESHIGWVTEDLVVVIDRTLNLRQSMREDLLKIAADHHATTEVTVSEYA